MYAMMGTGAHGSSGVTVPLESLCTIPYDLWLRSFYIVQ